MTSTCGTTALLLGVACHVCFFNRGEHHLNVFIYLQAFAIFSFVDPIIFVILLHYSPPSSLATTFTLLGSYLLGLFASLVIYRIFFNRLNKFPGPFGARISNFWQVFHFRKLDSYRKCDALHKKYGDFVRTGVTDLSITAADALEIAYGSGSTAIKGDWYDASAPLTSMHTCRDKGMHDKRRRIWSPAFSEKALREYESKIKEFNDKVAHRFGQFKGDPVNVTKWFNLYSFDVMGRLSFGKDYGMLDPGQTHQPLSLVTGGMKPLGFRFPIWFFRLMTIMPRSGTGFRQFVRFCVKELMWRLRNGETAEGDGPSDIMTSILKSYSDVKNPETDTFLHADARLLITAGSDTTASALTYLFFHLAQNPDVVANLRRELEPLTERGWLDQDIRLAPYLNACINEALRLHPPVPSGVARKTGKRGMQVGDTFIPPETTFWIPLYVVQRDERYFVDADRFVPERWTTKPGMIKHAGAFAPFSLGPFGCIGKNLALMEMRTLTTTLVLRYDISLAPGEDGSRLLYETKDHFILTLGQLDLVFSERG